MKQLEIYERAKSIGKYVVDKRCTVREASKVFNVSKSTVHKDITEVLNDYKDSLAIKCREVLNFNYDERHIRGGEATKKKYLKK